MCTLHLKQRKTGQLKCAPGVFKSLSLKQHAMMIFEGPTAAGVASPTCNLLPLLSCYQLYGRCHVSDLPKSCSHDIKWYHLLGYSPQCPHRSPDGQAAPFSGKQCIVAGL